MYTYYLTENDMLETNHFPIIALFNEALNTNIIEFYRNLCKGIGSGYNYSNCYFWDELDEYDQAHTSQFQGVCVETEDDAPIIVPYLQMLSYMKLASKRYHEKQHENEKILTDLIDRFKKKYLS